MSFLFTQVYNMIFDGLAKVITNISGMSIEIFSQSVVISLLNFFQQLGWIIFAVGVLFAIANFCMERTEGNYIAFEEMFKGIMLSMIAVAFMEPGSIFIFTMADTISSSIKDIATLSNATVVNNLVNALKSTLAGYSVLWAIFFALVYIVMLVVVFLQALKRSGVYVMQIMVGYLYVFGIPSGNTEGIFDWCRQTVALAATNVLQVACLIISINLILAGSLIPAIGMLFAASSAEKVAGRFGMSVGARQTLGSAGRVVSSVSQTISTVGSMARSA